MMRATRNGFSVSRSAILAVTAVTLVALAACGGTTEVEPEVTKDIIPASLTPVSTDTVRGTVGAVGSLPLTVIVKNQVGELLEGIQVTFAVATGGGSLANSSVRTNAAGQAATTWTLGPTAGLQTVSATVGTLAAVTFRGIASPGAAAIIAKNLGDNQTAVVGTNVSIAPSVRVTDALGNAVPNVTVSFVVASGGGLVNGGTANTNANGIATAASWRLGTTVGANSLTATAGALSVTFNATGTVGAPGAITLTPATIPELSVGQSQQLTPRVVDASGNVIANPTVAYSSSAPGVASVSTAGLITATGAGTATITAAAGTATASVALSVIGHPGSITPSTRFDYSFIQPSDVAFTKTGMFVAVNGTQKIYAYDVNGIAQTGTITVTSGLPLILAPTNAVGPLLAINSGIQSRVWFIDPAANAVVDSLDIMENVQSAAIMSDGARMYAMLSNGEIAVVDIATRQNTSRIAIGGGVTRIRMAPGDTSLFVLTNIGLVLEVDTRTNAVKRQLFVNLTSTDFVIARDQLFYMLDAGNNIVRLFDINTSTVVRTLGVPPTATTIAVTPDGQQVWLTHSTPPQVSIFTGNRNTGFLSTGLISLGQALPLRVFINPSGAIAVVSNIGGWVDIVR